LLVFYTGITRSASALLEQQSKEIAGDRKKQHAMMRIAELAFILRDELHKNNIATFGEILHESWMLKKDLTSGVSTGEIDEWYGKARSAGATGGKILGAGAGGFLVFSAPPEAHAAIRASLQMLRPIAVEFEPLGSRIIFYQ
jgi:D-glycero-alpha-D-manno-heptose-7-phosphate kinase